MELFDDFDPTPIGVASLAQVHVGLHRASGQKVAVKVSLYYKSHLRQYLKKHWQLSSNILTLRNFATLTWKWWRLLLVCVFLLIIWCLLIV
jgi:predicted unusual protein kinase regulating ubiquinone biosynthesis (AarF/ABC1/UbiB family)